MSDIRPYGSTEGLGFYWVRKRSQIGSVASAELHLVAIDDVGNVTDTGNRRSDEPAARDEGEAVRDHLEAGIKEANADLDRRRAKLDVPTEPAPELPDPATVKFYFSDDAEPWDMNL